MTGTGDRLEDEIERILASSWILEAPSSDPSRQILVMRHPTLKEKRIARFFKDKFMKDHRDTLMSQEEVEKTAFINGAWHPSLNKKIERLADRHNELRGYIEDERVRAKKVIAAKARVRSLKKEMAQLSYQLQALMLQKHNIFTNTLEFQAERVRAFHLIGLVTSRLDDTSVWQHGDIDNETDLELVEFLLNDFMEHQGIDSTLIRRIARSNLWAYRWQLGKKEPSALFDRKICDLTVEQSYLVFWSQIYDAVKEAVEPPPQSVIEDDEAFDKWLASKATKRKLQNTKRSLGLNKAGNEQFVVVDGYYDDEGYWQEFTEEEKQERVDAIYSCNSEMVRRMKRAGAERLKKMGGQASEVELRRGWFRLLGWDKVNE